MKKKKQPASPPVRLVIEFKTAEALLVWAARAKVYGCITETAILTKSGADFVLTGAKNHG